MSTLAALNIMIGANSAVLRKELTRAKKATGNFVANAKKQLGSLASNSARMGKSMGVGLAAGTATLGVGLVAMERTLKSIDDIRRQAANVSMPIEQYQAYAFATQAAGLEAENFGDVIKDLNAKITDFAVSGGGAMADFFAVTGQDIEQWQRLQPAEQFERFTKELENMSESQARFWLDEINDSASQMFSTLVGNKGEFASNVQLARDLGLVMSQDVIMGVQATYSEISTLKALLGGAWQHLVVAAAPAIKYITESLRSWLTDAANAEGGFANLGKALATSILGAVQSGIQGLSKLFHEVQSLTYKVTGEHAVTYIGMQKDLRALRREYQGQADAVKSNADNYAYLQQALLDVENGTRQLSVSQQAQARRFIADHEQSLNALGITTNKLNDLEQQISDFEQQEGISAPFTGAIGTIEKLKSEIRNTKIELSNFKPLDLPKAPDYKPQTVVQNPFATQLQQAQDYYALKKLMRDNDWSEEKAQLQLKLNSYAEANAARQINDEQYQTLAKFATDEFNQTQLQQNQSFLEQLRAQAAQTTQDYQSMWGQTFDRFTQGIGESVANAVMTQQSFSDSMKGIMRGVVKSTIAALAEMAAKRIAVWAMEKLLNKGAATSAAGVMTTQAQAVSLMAGLNAFQATAAIPYVGPMLAPGAMHAALAITQPMVGAIAGLGSGMVGMAHSGIDYIPREGTWLLDKGERVYTNENANQLDSMAQALGVLAANQAGSASESGASVTLQMNVNALDTNHFAQWFEDNQDDIARTVKSRFDYI